MNVTHLDYKKKDHKELNEGLNFKSPRLKKPEKIEDPHLKGRSPVKNRAKNLDTANKMFKKET